ncbi:related to Cuticle-degrading protease [Lecanosticta acicola]|uniref:Related to Cuticle-degrading protease n=1 Tax=Lecanosticta acicola TaxID=111012 RepID=A0AAI8Z1U2_9PEZI|nr:related to Cuticle-degrading protease [Lecanosticta acicola]
MSLGDKCNQQTSDAVAQAVNSSNFVSVAAGNDRENASGSSTASEPSVYTVGASDMNDKSASSSNYGSLVDIVAPGVNVLSTRNGSTTATEQSPVPPWLLARHLEHYYDE